MRKSGTIVLLLTVMLSVGCKGTTTQGTLYSMTAGRYLDTNVPRDLNTVYNASIKAIETMGYTIDTRAVDAREAKIEGKTALERSVRVLLLKTGRNITHVKIYIAGDEGASRELIDTIEADVL